MTVNGETKVLGIIGNPVKHTKSPAIHNYISKQLNKNMIYVPFEVTGDVNKAVQGAYELSIHGMNVTVPWKEEVIKSLVDIDDLARRIGAVNTLVRVDGGFKGYNTDMIGLEREFIDEGIELKGKDVVMIGAGGAARAVAFMCAKNDVKSITILNRTVEKAKAIADDVNTYIKDENKTTIVSVLPLSDYEKIEANEFIAIQCTKVGLAETDGAAIEDISFYKKVTYGVDLIYRDGTLFQQMVNENGGKAYTGMKMLLFQGIAAYELWNDVKISDEIINGVKEVLGG